ncbi:MAG: hypothetical protein MRK02_09090 [Candidatus Scalindua sp.]|nr:hypothetical protein [Candidatus Scalindua sp.]
MKIDNQIKKYRYNNNMLFHDFKYIHSLSIENGNRSYGIFNASLNSFFSFILAVFMLGIFIQTVQAKPSDNHGNAESKVAKSKKKPEDIREGDEWKFFKGDKKPKFKWNHVGYDDSKWLKGQSGFGYGNSKSKTKLNDMKDKYDSIYVRHEFTVDDPDKIKGMILTIDSDGAFIAYLNGIEVIRSKIKMFEELDISGFTHELFPGTNVLGIEGFNNRIDSEDFTFIPLLKFIEE